MAGPIVAVAGLAGFAADFATRGFFEPDFVAADFLAWVFGTRVFDAGFRTGLFALFRRFFAAIGAPWGVAMVVARPPERAPPERLRYHRPPSARRNPP